MTSQSTFDRLQSIQRWELTLVALAVLTVVAAILALLDSGVFAGFFFLLAAAVTYGIAKLLNLAGEILGRLDRLDSLERTAAASHPPTAGPPPTTP